MANPPGRVAAPSVITAYRISSMGMQSQFSSISCLLKKGKGRLKIKYWSVDFFFFLSSLTDIFFREREV